MGSQKCLGTGNHALNLYLFASSLFSLIFSEIDKKEEDTHTSFLLYFSVTQNTDVPILPFEIRVNLKQHISLLM